MENIQLVSMSFPSLIRVPSGRLTGDLKTLYSCSLCVLRKILTAGFESTAVYIDIEKKCYADKELCK